MSTLAESVKISPVSRSTSSWAKRSSSAAFCSCSARFCSALAFFLLTFHKAFLLVQFIPRSKSLSSSFDKISNIVQIPRRHQINSQKNKQATNQEGSNIGKKKGNRHVK